LYQAILSDPTFFSLLFRFDQDLAEATRRAGCDCGGRLDVANYGRKPRGGPDGLPAAFDLRLSFCCATDGCRKRATPPSVRFVGRRVYFMAIFVLVSAMRHGVNRKREAQLRALFGPSRRTLERWLRWWREAFPQTRLWREATGRFSPPVDMAALPQSLLERFSGPDEPTRVHRALAFLAPLGVAHS
jgi:hypothetical protein